MRRSSLMLLFLSAFICTELQGTPTKRELNEYDRIPTIKIEDLRCVPDYTYREREVKPVEKKSPIKKVKRQKRKSHGVHEHK